MEKPILQTESEEYENQHVHQVYEQIASHFSATRYKVGLPVSEQPISLYIYVTNVVIQPWPIVEKFLLDLPDGSVGLDIGCGNGKYLMVNPRLFIIGSDR